MQKKIGKALVVGAGISGIRTALDLAENGYGVTLIDKSPHLGGILSQLDYQFPTDHCGMCKMLPLVNRDASSQHCLRKGLFHENIDIMLATELIDVDGDSGNFSVRLKQRPNWVHPDKCIGCGMCTDVCPVVMWGSGSNLGSYNGATLFSDAQGMLTYMTQKMPLTAPGSLTSQQYNELLAYILTQANIVSPSTTFDANNLSSISIP